MNPIKFSARFGLSLVSFVIFPCTVKAVTVSGPITANSVIVTGNPIKVSNMAVSSFTITNSIDVQGTTAAMPGAVLQMKLISSTVTTTVTSTTFTAVSGIQQSIALFSGADYVRISLSGSLGTIFSDSQQQPVYITIFRDSTNLGDPTTGLSSLTSIFGYGMNPHPVACPLGIKILDSPGDTSLHTYQVYIRASFSGDEVQFPLGTGYMLLEEVGQ